MLRSAAAAVAMAGLALAACGHSGYAIRPVPRIAADHVGKPVRELQEAFGAPRKIETTPTKLVYVWFLEQTPAGAPAGFHGCEMEVSVDPRSEHILGYSQSNIGWAKCSEIVRKTHVGER
ncbi:MAG TPA: hypothetical protein VNR70_14845 [Steroidobacteraceae bacterium]|jgi:hypothetical protein|nr:hypothetical protein [Steroidobacteraceae bacterium]